jgi:hypothetical protein
MKIDNLFLVQNSTRKANPIECLSEQISFILLSKWYLVWIARLLMLLLIIFIFFGMIVVSESFLVSIEFILKKKKNSKNVMGIERKVSFVGFLLKTLSSCSFQIFIPLIGIVLHDNNDFADFGSYFVMVISIQIFLYSNFFHFVLISFRAHLRLILF